MPLFHDQTGREVLINERPQRIISIVPSQTELLFDLGLSGEVIGITKFCVHPEEWFRNKTRVGGTKTLNLEKIRSLQPDLILANKEENEKEQVEELAKEFPVWTSDISNLSDALEMISTVGKITGTNSEAEKIINEITSGFELLEEENPKAGPGNKVEKTDTLYLIWKDPYMSIGKDSFIHDMLTRTGLHNMCSEFSRYPQIDPADFARGCRLVLLSSEPYPFKQKHIAELKTLIPSAEVLLADGEMFSWYGSRLIKAASYFIELKKQIHAFH
jgi:ABC-type Fe3+-hydroxamate transport system substrate-binding protein